jgi:hypothetical protein
MNSNPEQGSHDDISRRARQHQAFVASVLAKYKTLDPLLAQGRWQEADGETRRLMLSIAGADRRSDCLLTETDIRSFPCTDLRILDRLWRGHSQGRFGFSVIHQIYQNVEQNYGQLAQMVGWRNGDRWINSEQIQFTRTAPVGHLPIMWLVPTTFSMYWLARFASAGWRLLLERTGECKL